MRYWRIHFFEANRCDLWKSSRPQLHSLPCRETIAIAICFISTLGSSFFSSQRWFYKFWQTQFSKNINVERRCFAIRHRSCQEFWTSSLMCSSIKHAYSQNPNWTSILLGLVPCLGLDNMIFNLTSSQFTLHQIGHGQSRFLPSSFPSRLVR